MTWLWESPRIFSDTYLTICSGTILILCAVICTVFRCFYAAGVMYSAWTLVFMPTRAKEGF